jgi:zinc transport system substrate-binding protein
MRLRFILFFVAVLAGAVPAQAAPPRVLVSILPIHSLVTQVMLGVGTPDLLIAGAQSEHGYSLKPSDARKISKAEIIFWIGPDLETYLISPLQTLNGTAHLVALGRARTVRRLAARHGGLWGSAQESDDGPVDPHVWLDAHNGIAMTRVIAGELAHDDPANAAKYYANATKTIADLTRVDREVAAKLAPVRNKPYIVFHDAYHYFEARYGLDSVGAVTVAPDRPIGPRRVAQLHDALMQGQALCIFREPQFPPALVKSLAEGTPARVGVLDPLGSHLIAGQYLYSEMLEDLATSLKRCLSRKPKKT